MTRIITWITGNSLFFTPNVQPNQVKKRKGSVNKHGQEQYAAADSSCTGTMDHCAEALIAPIRSIFAILKMANLE
jgi:hypothetical protein